MTLISAVEMAKRACVSPKSFRAALRKENFSWHDKPYMRWTVPINGREHADVRRVLNTLTLSGAMKGTVNVAPGVDLKESTGEVWDASQ